MAVTDRKELELDRRSVCKVLERREKEEALEPALSRKLVF